jgi:bZIP transcription factor
MSDTNADAARKRRIAMRNQKRSSSAEGDLEGNKRLRTSETETPSIEVVVEPVPSKPKPHITGIKKQSRYVPGVPMTREELKAWRKEARRVRNRESAAESRKKNRERVTELEIEVDGLKAKYAAALKMIIDLEASRSVKDCASFTPPALLRQDLLQFQAASRPASPNAPQVQMVSPPQSPSFPPSMATNEDLLCGIHQAFGHSRSQDHQVVAQHHFPKSQHQYITMISRPIACV